MIEINTDSDGKKYSNESILKGILHHTKINDYSNDSNIPAMIVQLDPGLFKENPSGWNIQEACNWLHNHSRVKSSGWCARFVRLSIEAGGLSTAGHPNWAWRYINYLPKIGFEFLGKFDNSYKGDGGTYSPQPGDIAVYTKGRDTSVPGHICMWTGVSWESDFKQKNMIVYAKTSQAYIFRFKNNE